MTVATHGLEARKVDVILAKSRLMSQPAAAQPSLWFTLAPALASGLLLWMCYFPLAWGWLGWIAVVPLLALVRAEARPRRIYWCAWLSGLVFYVPILQWMRVGDSSMYGAWILLALYCAAYVPVTLALVRLLERKTPLPLVFTFPISWTAMEFARSFMLTGFAWYYLGHTQHAMLSLIQIADLGGAYLVSFLVAAVNAWIFDLLYQLPGLRERFHWIEPPPRGDSTRIRAGGWFWRPGLKYEAGLLLVAFVGALFYGAWRLEQNQFEDGPLLALVQTNLRQKVRDAHDPAAIGQHCDLLADKALSNYPAPELIVWPETSFPKWWVEVSPRLAPERIPNAWAEGEREIRDLLSTREFLKDHPASHLLGVQCLMLDEEGKPHHYNSALLVRKSGQFAGRYDKVHRVPFGEFIPFYDSAIGEWFPFVPNLMSLLSPYPAEYSVRAGAKFTRFDYDKYRFGVLICYEDTDPFLAPRYVRAEPEERPVDFLLNISNDGWFDGTSEHEEHLAISRFRAIECRRALARSVNMGISAVIDGNGRVLKPLDLPPPSEPHVWKLTDNEELPVSEWQAFKKTSGVLLARIPLDRRDSFYARAGDWLPYTCWVILGGVIAWSLVQRRRTAIKAV